MKSSVQLVLMQADQMLSKVSLVAGSVKIGRHPHNDLVIDHVAISGEHAVVLVTNGDACIEDLNSTNGTKVNGQPIHRHFLREDDLIELGQYAIRYEVLPTVVAIPRLEILSGFQIGEKIVLSKTLTTVGMPRVGSAVIVGGDDGYYLTFIEGPGVTAEKEVELGDLWQKLNHGDVFEIAETVFRFHGI